MRRAILLSGLAILVLAPARHLAAHCEVPCGIYADQRRFEMMLENNKTIAKAIDELGKLAGHGDAQSINQMGRWVTTKEEHATDTQHIIAQYFMTQRIKADQPEYVKKLTAAHAVMVSAMKCKQAANPTTTKALEKAIYDFYRAYEGKEPQFHEH